MNSKSTDPLSIPEWFDSSNYIYILKNCPRPLNIVKASILNLEYFENKCSTNAGCVVLADIFQQMEASTRNDKDDEDDLHVFQGLWDAHAINLEKSDSCQESQSS